MQPSITVALCQCLVSMEVHVITVPWLTHALVPLASLAKRARAVCYILLAYRLFICDS